MRDLKNKLTSSKNTKNIQARKGKSFGYQVLGFGAGGSSAAFIDATGGTITTDTDYRIHTFTGPGNFVVNSVGDAAGSETVSYMVVAGGGGGGAGPGPGSGDAGGSGGAGGFRESKASTDSYTASPLNATTGPTYNLPVSATSYPIVIGAGGAGSSAGSSGSTGAASSGLGISSAGGGNGRHNGGPGTRTGGSGGSGGGPSGGGTGMSGGAGNTPPVSPAQGFAGSSHCGSPDGYGGAGGGATGAGQDAPGGNPASQGGAAATTSITAAAVTYSGGGGGGGACSGPGGQGGGTPTPGCRGGGGPGANAGGAGNPGTANTGGGGGGGGSNGGAGAAGGSGIVVIRYKFQQDKLWHILQKYQKQRKYLQY